MNLEKLIKGLEEVRENDVVLYCFPYAGGGASVFRNWKYKLGDSVKVCPIQLPGREERISEKPYVNMDVLAADLADIIASRNNEFIIFGHSMGTKIAYEVEKRLEIMGRIAKLLIVSGGRAPHIQELNPIYNLSDDEFKQGIIRFNGMPKEIIQNKELFEFFLPVMRADFTLDESYKLEDAKILKTPIMALWGKEDKEGNFEEIIKWKEYTESYFKECSFQGEHFFIRVDEKSVLKEIKKQISICNRKL